MLSYSNILHTYSSKFVFYQSMWRKNHIQVLDMCNIRTMELNATSEFSGLLVSRPYPAVPYFYFKKRKWNLAPPGASILLQKKRKALNSGFVQIWQGLAAKHPPFDNWDIEIQITNKCMFGVFFQTHINPMKFSCLSYLSNVILKLCFSIFPWMCCDATCTFKLTVGVSCRKG